MLPSRVTLHSRVRLDQRFLKWPGIPLLDVPGRGWIRAIREALSMSAEQLGARLGVKQPSVVGLEQSEAKETIQLATLRRVAAALDCTLVYALVPNRPLTKTVAERAREIAKRQLLSVEHSILLEDQAVSPEGLEQRIDELASAIRPSQLWNDV